MVADARDAMLRARRPDGAERAVARFRTAVATPTVSGVHYTVIESVDDEVVTPYTNAFLPAAANVTIITVQSQCVLDGSDHLEVAADPIALADMLSALDPSAPVHVPCLVVLPITGLTGPVPAL
jgi:hypothetical protein